MLIEYYFQVQKPNFICINLSITMKNLICVVLLLSICTVFGQGTKLTRSQTDAIFTETLKSEFKMEFPVYRAFSYKDKTGKYYVALSEKMDGISGDDTLHSKIKGVSVKDVSGKLTKQWEINDFTEGEQSIWFWSKYCSFTDIDKDGIAEPIITYGSKGDNGFDDGRIKILIFYKGEKIAIRHQNGTLDDERNTQVDPKFYTLPSVIQEKVKSQMKKMMDNNLGIFPYGWEKNMKNKKTKFSESSSN